MIKEAPRSFVVSVAFASVLIFFAVDWHYSGEMGARDATIALQAERLSDYQAKLKGASPSEVASQIRKLTNDNQSLTAKETQIAAYDWQRLKPFQIADLRNRFGARGRYPLSVVWGSDDSAYGLAADVGNACQAAQWSVCTPEKLPNSMEVIGMHVHWQAGYQSIAIAVAESLTKVIGVQIKAEPVAEPNLKTPLEVMVGRKVL